MMNAIVLTTLVFLTSNFAHGFYLPGVSPKSFVDGENVELKVNKLTSIEDPFPLDYYTLPFCQPDKIEMMNENLGEFLTGDRIENSPYIIKMKTDMYCEQVCVKNLGKPEVSTQDRKKKRRPPNKTVDAIRKRYHNNWIVDNLPAASRSKDYGVGNEVLYWQGFAIGFTDESGLSYINNHVNIELQYHSVETDEGKYRIVGFIVEPFSVKHKFTDDGKELTIKNAMSSCSKDAGEHTSHKMTDPIGPQLASGQVLFTYDVIWSENPNLHWASRWDIYLNMNDTYPIKIHWVSIANSLVIVLVLSAMIAAILVRNLRRDVARYQAVPTDEERAEDLEEFGWKLVHADVFRPPSYPMLISICSGSGCQILFMTLFTIIFASMGFLSPSNRGYLVITLLVLYVLMGSVAGYAMARMYKTFKGKSWQKATTLTAISFPGIAFTIFFILNLFAVSQNSSDAVPFHTMVTLMALWFGISTPLVFLGATIGFKKDAIEFPVNTSNIPRKIPAQPWFMGAIPTLIIGGIMPFGSCFLELYFLMSSVWMHQYYYVFGILFVVFLILLLTCAEIAILYNYFQLCGEDYQWWWRSYNTSGSIALYVFGYSFVYFQQLQVNTFSSYALYFGYMGLVSFMIFLMTGCVGLYSSLYFNKIMFASIKID